MFVNYNYNFIFLNRKKMKYYFIYVSMTFIINNKILYTIMLPKVNIRELTHALAENELEELIDGLSNNIPYSSHNIYDESDNSGLPCKVVDIITRNKNLDICIELEDTCERLLIIISSIFSEIEIILKFNKNMESIKCLSLQLCGASTNTVISTDKEINIEYIDFHILGCYNNFSIPIGSIKELGSIDIPSLKLLIDGTINSLTLYAKSIIGKYDFKSVDNNTIMFICSPIMCKNARRYLI